MGAAALETRELLIHGAQLLEAGERADDRRESASEVERRHIRLDELHAFAHLR